MASSIFPTKDSGIFIPSLWQLPSGQFTQEYADLHYLKFPIGQGSETLPKDLTVSGTTTLGTLSVVGQSTLSNLTAIGAGDIYMSIFTTQFNKNIATLPVTGGSNCMYGYNAGKLVSSGGTNCAFGHLDCLSACESGASNTAIGNGALKLATASFNTALGYNAGTALTTGSSNTYIGSGAASSATVSNSTAIGAGATITASNQVVLGTASETVVCPNTVTVTALLSVRNIKYSSPPMFSYSFTSTTQSIPNGTEPIVNFPVAGARNSTFTGLTYSAGGFTNSNSYSIGVSISVSISFSASAVGYRAVIISTSAGRIGMVDVGANPGAETVLSCSANAVINSGEVFYIQAFQNSGGALDIGASAASFPTRVSVVVF